MRGFAEKGPVPRPGRCLWCGGRLIRFHVDPDQVGYLGRGFFCTASCGWHFGVRMAELGKRLQPTDTTDDEQGANP